MKAKVKFEIEAPCQCTEQEFIEWIEFNLGYVNEMKTEPLGDWEFAVDYRPRITMMPQGGDVQVSDTTADAQ